MNDTIIESAQRQSDLVDKIAEVAFQRGQLTKSIDIKLALIKALENNQIDIKTFHLIDNILYEAK